MHVARAEWASANAEGDCYKLEEQVKHMGVRREQFTTLVTLCRRALPLVDSTWCVE
jgi:hypothetical protein